MQQKTQKWIGIAPFAQYDSKVYPQDLMQKVIEELASETTNKIFLFGGGNKEIEILNADNDFIRKKAKANFKTLGKKLGAKMKWAADEIAKFTNDQINQLDTEDILLQSTDNETIGINKEDIEVVTDEIPGFEIASKGSLTVALDINISDNLKKEGNAREFINKIQNIRKDQNFEIADRIIVEVEVNDIMELSLNEYKAYICGEILADSLQFKPTLSEGVDIEVNEAILKVNVLKK